MARLSTQQRPRTGVSRGKAQMGNDQGYSLVKDTML